LPGISSRNASGSTCAANLPLNLWRIEIMLKVTKPGKPVMVHTYGDNLLAHVCLDLAGGGYTTKQTIEAMTTQAALERDGIVKTRRYTIERIADDSPAIHTFEPLEN
jgi:hypothetical protein